MVYLNIETSLGKFNVEMPKQLANEAALDMWYSIERFLPEYFIDALESYTRSTKPQGTKLPIDFRSTIHSIRQENYTIKTHRKPGQLLGAGYWYRHLDKHKAIG
jgi:hypothetical protein